MSSFLLLVIGGNGEYSKVRAVGPPVDPRLGGEVRKVNGGEVKKDGERYFLKFV
jgi:hypothetical protein